MLASWQVSAQKALAAREERYEEVARETQTQSFGFRVSEKEGGGTVHSFRCPNACFSPFCLSWQGCICLVFRLLL